MGVQVVEIEEEEFKAIGFDDGFLKKMLLKIYTFYNFQYMFTGLKHEVNHRCFSSVHNFNHKTCLERLKCFGKGINFLLTD